jgi:hypothetical protein
MKGSLLRESANDAKNTATKTQLAYVASTDQRRQSRRDKETDAKPRKIQSGNLRAKFFVHVSTRCYYARLPAVRES